MRKLNKPLKTSKYMQRDAKQCKETKSDVTEREGTERSGHHRGFATTQWYLKRSEGVARPVKVSPKYTTTKGNRLKRIRHGQTHGQPVRDAKRVKTRQNASNVKTIKTGNGKT